MGDTYRSPRHAGELQRWCLQALAEWRVEHQLHELDTSVGRTRVVTLGSGERACLYLPGTNFSAASSTVILEALGTRFSVFSADLPGQPGLSAAQRPREEVAGYSAWLADVTSWVRSVRPDQPLVVVGHSRGAAVALSADHETVDGVVLLSPAGLTSVRPTAQMLRATMPWLVRRDQAGAARLLQYMSGPGHSPTPRLVTWMALVARTCRTTGAPRPYPDDVVERWRGGRVRVVVGSHDVFFPAAQLREACRSKLGTDPTVVEGAGHLLVDEEPDVVTRVVADLV